VESKPDPHRRNRLLAALRPPDFALLEPHLQVVLLGEGELLHLPGDVIQKVYFLHSGIVALMAVAKDGEAVSTASVGREGAIGTIAGSGIVRAFTRALVQAPGSASRLPIARFREALRKSDTLSDLMTRYHMAMMAQVQQTSLCNSLHDATSRLSRLLLLLDTQSDTDDISLTQDRLATMLGLRRTSVTLAAQALQEKGLIRYRRGRIEILDRKGLVAVACECYGVMRRTFDQLLEAERR
jgi:CRP-like cAMP-binding protein